MNELVTALRQTAEALLPPGAFLRRDRGDALFVTDAPRRGGSIDWGAAGFLCREAGGLACLTPNETWLHRLEAQYSEPPNPFCAAFQRFRGPADPESLRLFAWAVKALDGGAPDPGCEKALRRRAAVCLRERLSGGGLYACAIAISTSPRNPERKV